MNPERELDPSNLITLCSNSCHIMFGHLMDFKSYNVKIKEDCAEWTTKIVDRPYHT